MATTRRLRCLGLKAAPVGAVLVSLVASGCGATPDNASDAGGSASREATIYRATIAVAGTHGRGQRIEWLNPQSGAWRAEEPGATRIFTGSSYVVIDRWGARVRSGSRAFLGARPSLSLAMGPIRSYLAGTARRRGVKVARPAGGLLELRFSRGGHDLVARVERAPLADAAELFGSFDAQVVVDEREIAAGEPPSVPVRPYWLAPAFDVGVYRRARTAVQYHSIATPAMLESKGWSAQDNANAYIVFYEDSTARGRTSATSSAQTPRHEIQVVSQPITSAAARQDLAAFDGVTGDLRGPVWPRRAIRLANGEPATLFIDSSREFGREGISFAVATSSTLVHVMGDVQARDIAKLARKLVPVTP
jgi:hypothetical protein